MDTDRQLKHWQDVYKDWFGLEIDPSSIKIPQRQSGFDRLIIMSKGLTINQVVVALRKKFKVLLYIEDLDADFAKTGATNSRTNAQSYAIWVPGKVEVDKKNKNILSANDYKALGIDQTLLERLLHEIIYFTETKKHLDTTIDLKNWSYCFGSHGPGGEVPFVYWEGKFRYLDVGCIHPGSGHIHVHDGTS